MEAQKFKIRIAAARRQLREAYQRSHPGSFRIDADAQAHLHCRRMAGIEPPYTKQIDVLEALEDEYEDKTGDISRERWELRRMHLDDIIDSGCARNEEIVAQLAKFSEKINQKLSATGEPQVQVQQLNPPLYELLHPIVIDSSWEHYCNGHLRDAVLNSMLALGDLIRERTGLLDDGKVLAEKALSIRDPLLVLSELQTESGNNDQKGFMQMIAGAFIGIRNPKAHSLQHDLTPSTAAQYLVLVSLLVRRIGEAQSVG